MTREQILIEYSNPERSRPAFHIHEDVNGYLAHFDFPSVLLFPIPSLVFIQKLEVTPVHWRTDLSLYGLDVYKRQVLVWLPEMKII